MRCGLTVERGGVQKKAHICTKNAAALFQRGGKNIQREFFLLKYLSVIFPVKLAYYICVSS